MLTRFENYIRHIKGYSDRTCSEYLKDLKGFAKWAKTYKEDARWSTLTRSDIDEYISCRAKEGIKPSTTNRELASISALYRYFQREGLLKDNPAKYESRRKQPERQPNTIDICELRQAFEQAFGIDKYMLGLLITTGIRISELLALKWEDFDYNLGAIRIMGKGATERTVYPSAEVLSLFHELSERFNPTSCVFNLNERDARYRIYQALRPYCHGKQLSPHAIRHTIATYWAKNGANVTTIANALGHNRIETTQQYIDLAQSDTRNLMRSQSII